MELSMNNTEKEILESFKNIPIRSIESFCGSHQISFSLESHNIAGSIKDKNAYYLIKKAESRGLLKPGGTIIESSSGNLGIAFAVIGKKLGYKVHIVIDQKTSLSMRQLLKLYGAQISEIFNKHCDYAGSMQKARMEYATNLQKQIPNSWYACQHLNPDTADAHYYMTAPNLETKMDANTDAIFIGVSTAGQLSGISKYLKQKRPKLKVIAVDIKGSGVFSPQRSAYKITGLGLSFTPPAFNWNSLDRAYQVSDELTISSCHYLSQNHGLFLGASTGTLYAAAQKWLREHRVSKNICIISSDGGERYLDTIYNDQWLIKNNIQIKTDVQTHSDLGEVIEFSRQQYLSEAQF